MSGLDRRALLAGVGGALLAVAPRVWAETASAPASPFLDRLCELTIPDTDTPGAKAVGVPAFLTLAVAHRLNDADPDTLTRFEAALDAEVRRRGGASGFTAASPALQLAVLGEVDARVFAGHGPPPAGLGDLALWDKVKGLILAGYYTSEVGASKELAYDLVPGRFDPDIPLAPGARAYFTDWTAELFG